MKLNYFEVCQWYMTYDINIIKTLEENAVYAMFFFTGWTRHKFSKMDDKDNSVIALGQFRKICVFFKLFLMPDT